MTLTILRRTKLARIPDSVLDIIVVVGFPAELLLVIMIEKLTRFDYRPLLNVRVRNGVGDHHPD